MLSIESIIKVKCANNIMYKILICVYGSFRPQFFLYNYLNGENIVSLSQIMVRDANIFHLNILQTTDF